MSTARRLHYTYSDYLSSLALSDVKLEYCDGEIYAMAGGTASHAALGAALIQALGRQIGDACRVYSSDLKIRVETSDLSTFPDVSLVCGEARFASVDRHALINPSVLAEVTSRSTEDYDRGDKLSHYKQIPTLKAVLLVSHREQRVTLHMRSAAGWEQREFRGSEELTLAEPALRLSLDELYRGISLDEA